MKNVSMTALGWFGMGALALGLASCGGNGSFVGPPQGSSFGARGTVPLIGATPLTFAPEIREITGIAVDHWFLDPGQDTNEAQQGSIPLGDGINALADGRFEEFVSGNATQQSPGFNEINVQYPMVVSFLAQWFGRNPDNSRPQEIDVFGRLIWSEAALDISFISGLVREQRDMGGNLLSVLMDPNFPNKDNGAGGPNFPLKNWTSPPTGDGAMFPFPFQVFTANQFNRLGLIRFGSVTSGTGGGAGGGGVGGGGGQSGGTTALGSAIADNADNVNVETMLSLPQFDPITGLPRAVRSPLGVYSDSYSLSYRFAPLRQPPVSDPQAIPPIPPPKIDNPLLEDALIEFSRHMAAIHANLIGQAVGVAPGNEGTLMDPVMVQFVNGFQYRFHSDDVDQFSQQSLPGRGRDPLQGTGGSN